MTDFQSSAGVQGRQFASQCDRLLRGYGYQLGGSALLRDIGVEIDCAATSSRGVPVWFEYKGSVQGTRPGLLRTDTLKKAIANGALLAAVPNRRPYVVLTSHIPNSGSGLAMLQTALSLGYLTDVVCIYKPADTQRLRTM